MGSVLGTHALVAHPAAPPEAVRGVEVDIRMTEIDHMLLTYRVFGHVPIMPEVASPARADGLWHTTCFEIFAQPNGEEAYFEFNFSPSSQWAAYAFDSYRQGMRDQALSVEPIIEHVRPNGSSACTIAVDLDLSDLPKGPLSVGLAAVIEEAGGRKSYWALAHAPAKPDFHAPVGFVLEVP